MAYHKTVLLCDHDVAELNQIAEALQQQGFEVATIQDAALLVSRVQQRKYAVVVVNPDMQGFDAAAVCKTIKQEAGIPVVLILERNSTFRNTIDACTADDVMTKPIDTSILANLLNKNFTWSRAVEE